MIYEVRARIYFDIQDEATDFYHDCQLALAKGTVVNPGNLDQEVSAIELIENHHDDSPNGPCNVLVSDDNAPA